MESTFSTRAVAQAVLDHIHEHPEEHHQSEFYRSKPLHEPSNGACGTAMCIAGTATWLTHGINGYMYLDAEAAAAELLGLNAGEAHAIFYDMDNESAVQKLKKIVVGEEFSDDDYKRYLA